MSAVAHAVVGVISKSANDILVRRAFQETTPGVIGLALTPFLPLPTGEVWVIIIGTGFVHFIYQMMQVNAYRLGDFSIVYPVSRGAAPLLAAGGAILWLSEPLTPWHWFALGLTSLGLLAFAWDGLKNQSHAHAHWPAIAFALGTAIMVAAYTVVDAKGMRLVSNPFTFIAWMFVANGIGITIASIFWRGRALAQSTAQEWRPGVLAGCISFVGYGLFLYGVRIGQVAELSALRETSVIFGALFGIIIFRDPFGPIRLLGALAVTIGVVALHLA